MFAKHEHTVCPSRTDTPHEQMTAYVSFQMRPYSPQSIENSTRYYCNTYGVIYVMCLPNMHTQDVRPGRTPCPTHPCLCKLPNEVILTLIHWDLSKIWSNYTYHMIQCMNLPNMNTQDVRPGRTCCSTHPCLCKLPNEALHTQIHWDPRKIWSKYTHHMI